MGDIRSHADTMGMRVLCGRAVDGPNPVTYRPLTEAFLVPLRDGQLPELGVFGPAVRQLLPGLLDVPGDSSVIAVAEGVLRLLRLLGQGRGCLLVLEDLHWADPETLAVLEYLGDHCEGERLACVATLRAEESTPALALASALDARVAGRRISLRRLSDHDVSEMVRACLSASSVPSEIDRFVRERADGLPFFVEELLVGLERSGALELTDGGWRAMSRLVSAVPLTVASSIRARLDAAPGLHEVLTAAATLGRRFDWPLLSDITGKSEAQVLDALRAGTSSQLLDADDSGFRFRHALTRDVVLSTLLPPERAWLAARAADAMEHRYPALDGERCELAAGLHESAGQTARAAALLVRAANRARRRGSLDSAEALLSRASELGDADAGFALLNVLATGGHTARASALGDTLLSRLPTKHSVVEVRIALARAAINAGKWDLAAAHIDRAGEVLAVETDKGRDRAKSAQAMVLAAQVAMGQGDEARAAELARSVLGTARLSGLVGDALGPPDTTPQAQVTSELVEIACEALEILGRVVRAADLPAAEALFERALRLAEEAGLSLWRLRALHELGTIDLLDTGRLDRLETARALAEEIGALAVLAAIDLHLGDALHVADRLPEAIVATTRCVELSRRLGLSTMSAGLGHLAGHEASAGRREVMDEQLAELRRIAPNEPDALIGESIVLGLYAVGQVDDEAAMRHFDQVVALLDRYPTVPFPQRGIWALLHTVYQTPRAAAARETVRTSGAMGIRAVRALVAYADAVAAGQDGRPEHAADSFAEAERIVDEYRQPAFLKQPPRRLVAIAALRDGWGEPVSWLRGALVWGEETGRERFAADCRARLKRAGAPVPRRRAGTNDRVPEQLRALGVTAREMDVLALIADGLSNAEIGERLYISARTVEKHVEKLLAKTGTRTRGQLAVRTERLRMG